MPELLLSSNFGAKSHLGRFCPTSCWTKIENERERERERREKERETLCVKERRERIEERESW